MIEDPKFTLEVLKYFAKEDIGFPANVSVEEDLVKEFADVTLDYLQYHILCAIQSDLLMAKYNFQYIPDGAIFSIGRISGLSSKGGDYVRNSETKYWDEALDKIKIAGMAITTSALLQYMNVLIADAIG